MNCNLTLLLNKSFSTVIKVSLTLIVDHPTYRFYVNLSTALIEIVFFRRDLISDFILFTTYRDEILLFRVFLNF